MIGKAEIVRIAGQLNLNPHVVEKDYALGWLLAGIFANDKIADGWVFKGGTCLKKCFFETYRFSEDLDFTLTDESHLDEEFLKEVFSEVGEWVYEQSGLEVPGSRQEFEIYDNPRGRKNCQGKLSYRGPVSPTGGGWPRIKLDLTADERLVLLPVRVPIFHPYSDAPLSWCLPGPSRYHQRSAPRPAERATRAWVDSLLREHEGDPPDVAFRADSDHVLRQGRRTCTNAPTATRNSAARSSRPHSTHTRRRTAGRVRVGPATSLIRRTNTRRSCLPASAMDDSAKLRWAPDNMIFLGESKSTAMLPRPLRTSDRISDGEGISEAFRSAHKRSLLYLAGVACPAGDHPEASPRFRGNF